MASEGRYLESPAASDATSAALANRCRADRSRHRTRAASMAGPAGSRRSFFRI